MGISKKNNLIEIKELLLKVFTQAEEESKETQAYGLSQYLNKKLDDRINERTLTRYYNGYVLNNEQERKKPTRYNLDILSQYLGCKNYRDFLSKKNTRKNLGIYKIQTITSIIFNILLVIVLSFFISKYYKKNCMIWVGDHYEKIRCSGIGNEEELDPIRLKKLRKITVCRDTIFFKNSKARIWYDKTDNVRTYFSYYGINPENGKSLHDITQPIIDNHIPKCD